SPRSFLNSDDSYKFFYSRRRLLECRAFFKREADLNNLLDATRTDFDRHTYIESADSVLTFQVSSGWHSLLSILQDCIQHLYNSGGRCIPGAGLQQSNDLRSAVASAL